MCGIAGIIRLSEKPLPESDVARRMIASLVHRGPDEWGEYRDEYVHLSAVRLSILDVTNGSQPALSPSLETVVVYNGETYNYRDLTTELISAGHSLPNQSDTAILPHLYEQYGEKFFSKLSGMFAFALWDKKRKRAVLCRDRLGIKPLLIANTGEYLLFASEIKAILASGLVTPKISTDSLDDLFSMSYPCPPATMFEGISELLPAHYLKIDVSKGSCDFKRYWEIPFAAKGEHTKISAKDAAVEYRERLQSAVQSHMVSDVGVGTYLSGGIDSSAITTFAQRSSPHPVDCFTLTFQEEVHNEESKAKKVASFLNADHHLIRCEPNLAQYFPKMIYHTELPLQYPVGLPLLYLSSEVNRFGHKVILTGEGADEQLAGYECFRVEKISRALNFAGGGLLKKSLYNNLFRWIGSPDGLGDFLSETQRLPQNEILRSYSGVKPPWFDIWNALDVDRTKLLSVDNRKVRPISEAPRGFSSIVPDFISELELLDSMLMIEMKTRLSSWGMVIEDRISMANSIETRVPFLDHQLVEWVAKLHPSLKLRGLREKFILKEAMAGVLPEEIRTRKKQPFYSPITEWFFSPAAPDYVAQLLSEDSIAANNYFNPEVVSLLRQKLASTPHSSFLRLRLEWILILVLGVQLLDELFIKEISSLTQLDWKQKLAGMRHTSC